MHQYFCTEEEGGKRKRRCTHDGCSKTFHWTASHVILKNHVAKHEKQDKTTSFTFSDSHTTDALIKWIITDRKSYCMVESKGFRDFMRACAPTVSFPGRDTISQIIRRKTTDLRPLVKQRLEQVSSIALTFDMWSSREGYGYGGLQGHFFDESGVLRSLTLEFKIIPHPHDGPAIRDFFREAINSYGIEKKVIAVTTDSATNNTAAIEPLLQELQLETPFTLEPIHYRCTSHILNLAVQEALIVLRPLIEAVRSFVLAIRSSGKREDKFESYQKEIHEESRVLVDDYSRPVEVLKLVEDCPTRWNSTYLMLERAFRLRESIDRAYLLMTELKLSHTLIDWELVQELIKFLEPFYELTVQISGENYTTLPLVNVYLPALIKHLRSADYSHSLLKEAAAAVLRKLDKYGPHTDQPVAVIATILDPRFKLSPIDPAVRPHITQTLERILNLPSESPAPRSQSVLSGIWAEPESNEIKAYLGSNQEPRSCDVALYWLSNESKFPALAKLARTVLNIQATSVACERIFSRAGLVDNQLRASLSSDSFRSNILLHSWLKFLNYSC